MNGSNGGKGPAIEGVPEFEGEGELVTGEDGLMYREIEVREQDRFLPVANIARIMKKVLPANAKIAKDGKETIQNCVSEFISFITSEASEKCQQEKRKTINGDDILWAMSTLGMDKYIEPLRMYLVKYRESVKGEKPDKKGSSSTKRENPSAATMALKKQAIETSSSSYQTAASSGVNDYLMSQVVQESQMQFLGVPDVLGSSSGIPGELDNGALQGLYGSVDGSSSVNIGQGQRGASKTVNYQPFVGQGGSKAADGGAAEAKM